MDLDNDAEAISVEAIDLGSDQTASDQAPATLAISGMRSISAGVWHTCLVNSAGAAQCWGKGGGGQLGNGSGEDRNTPVAVSGLSSGVIMISAGEENTCALLDTGGVKCWGYGSPTGYGFIGSSTPVDVSGLTSGVAAVSVGWGHACALLNTGAVKCWGSNRWGQLGNGLTGIGGETPVDVTGLSSGVTAISAGTEYSCAVLHLGGIKCWGRSYSGQLGDGTFFDSRTPVDVSGLSSAVAVAAGGSGSGSSTCALTNSGAAKCWGDNYYGALGNGSMANSSNVPVDVHGISAAVSLSVGDSFACATLSTGALQCWGYNDRGQLGNNQTVNSRIPVGVSELSSGVAAVTTGGFHACALLSSGKLKCWGENTFGELGDGTNIERHTPVDVVF